MMVVSHGFSILIGMDQTIHQRLINFAVYCLHYYAVAKVNNVDYTHPYSSLISKITNTRMSFIPRDQLRSVHRQMKLWVHHLHHQNLVYRQLWETFHGLNPKWNSLLMIFFVIVSHLIIQEIELFGYKCLIDILRSHRFFTGTGYTTSHGWLFS